MVAGVVMAAGRSSRMGQPKAFLAYDSSGTTFLIHLVRTALEAGVHRVFVVGRPEDGGLREEAVRLGGVFVPNPLADSGQLSSVLAGLAAADTPDLDAILLMPVDVPIVSAALCRDLMHAGATSSASIVRPVYRGRGGHPVLFTRAVFEELRQADPSQGARAVVRADPTRVCDLEVDEAGVAMDVDTPEDYERIFGRQL